MYIWMALLLPQGGYITSTPPRNLWIVVQRRWTDSERLIIRIIEPSLLASVFAVVACLYISCCPSLSMCVKPSTSVVGGSCWWHMNRCLSICMYVWLYMYAWVCMYVYFCIHPYVCRSRTYSFIDVCLSRWSLFICGLMSICIYLCIYTSWHLRDNRIGLETPRPCFLCFVFPTSYCI